MRLGNHFLPSLEFAWQRTKHTHLPAHSNGALVSESYNLPEDVGGGGQMWNLKEHHQVCSTVIASGYGLITDPICGTPQVTGRCRPIQRVNNTKRWWFLCCYPRKTFQQTPFRSCEITVIKNSVLNLRYYIRCLLQHTWLRKMFWQEWILLVIWNAMKLIWRHSDDRFYRYTSLFTRHDSNRLP